MSATPPPTVGQPYDEAYTTSGETRAHYVDLLAWLEATDLEDLRNRVDERLDDDGVTFTTGEGDERFTLDLVPRLVTAAEWDLLSAGLEQRVRALNAFVTDVYGPQRIVEAGVIPAAVIEGADGFLPELRGAWPGGEAPIGVAGLDVVRDEDGSFTVLEDNTRTPSGYAYAAAARDILESELAGCGIAPRPMRGALGELLGMSLRAAAPGGDGDPSIVVLTDGRSSSAWFEHALAARALEVPLVTLDDLDELHGRLVARTDTGVHAVDVVYRRCDEDRLRDAHGALTAVGEALGPPWRAGKLGVVNAFGSGVADDKLVHAYVEEMIVFYLEQEPLVASIPTIDLGRPEACERVLADLRGYVVKPRAGFGGHGVVVGAHADTADLDTLADAVRADPSGFIAQRTVALSTHPTVTPHGCLAPRHVDLRPFVFSGGGASHALPGGLTRVALDEGALVVNSSQNGGGKDTWVLP